MTDNTRELIEQIFAIPAGKVSSYRDIALKAGIPNGARQTVRTLHSMSEKFNLPWHNSLRSSSLRKLIIYAAQARLVHKRR